MWSGCRAWWCRIFGPLRCLLYISFLDPPAVVHSLTKAVNKWTGSPPLSLMYMYLNCTIMWLLAVYKISRCPYIHVNQGMIWYRQGFGSMRFCLDNCMQFKESSSWGFLIHTVLKGHFRYSGFPLWRLKYVFSQTITCINDFVLCTLLRACKLLRGLDLLIPLCMGRLIYNYHHSTILHWKISQVCCRLYCYECAAHVK